MRLLALADDATGALEVGGELARRLEQVRVWFGDESPDPGLVDELEGAVINTRSRHVTPAEAEARLRRAAIGGAERIFKKTDSTLRGNIAAEFRGLIQAYPGRPIVYAPAFPDQGRTVVEGELFVHGQPLAETAFASDPLNPAGNGRIPELLRACGVPVTVMEPGQLAEALDRSKAGEILVCDGRENSDLVEVARVLREPRVNAIATGASAFAGYWASDGEPHERRMPPSRHGLVVNGSLHPVSRAQIAWAGAAGWAVGRLEKPPAGWEPAPHSASVGRGNADQNWTVLATGDSQHGDPLGVARQVGAGIRRIIKAGDYDTLVVFGGDTLDAILRALGCDWVESLGLTMPGIPLSRIEFGGRAITLITKAGGFGGEDVLGRIRARLEKSE